MSIKILNLGTTKCYLLSYQQKYLLVDTGYENTWSKFLKELSRHQISLHQISHLILTHHHDDHCGLLRPLTAKNRDLIVVLGSEGKNLLEKGRNDVHHGAFYLNSKVYRAVSWVRKFRKNWDFTFTPFFIRDQDILIQEEITDFREIDIHIDGKIVKTPGHTVDSISVLLDNGNCFVGDSAANFLSFLGTKNCIIFLGNINHYYRSWEVLIRAGAQQIYPAHGKSFSVDRLSDNLWKNKEEDLIMYE